VEIGGSNPLGVANTKVLGLYVEEAFFFSETPTQPMKRPEVLGAD
jgi:hypothetical protein